MISKEEKARRLKEIIQIFDDNSKKEEIQKQIYNLLIEDTDGTLKLYKYRKFDEKGYHLNSLKTGTMWCSAPNDFNDPFDSKIGISIQTAQQVVYKNDWSKLNVMINALSQVINNEIPIDKCDNSIKPVLEELLKNEKIVFMLHDAKNLDKENKEECDCFATENLSLSLEIIQTLIENSGMSQPFQNASKLISQIVSMCSDEDKLKLFETNASLNAFAEICDVNNDGDEIDLILGLGEKFIDDKLEISKAKNIFEDVPQQLEKEINNMFFIGCLATTPKNRLMWSHYSENHSGFCIEYDFSDWDYESFGGCLLPIIYSQEMPQIPWKYATTKSSEAQQAFMKELLFGLLMKDDIWEYENEWRILIPQNNGAKYIMPKISCIYLGKTISEENKEKVIEIAKDKCISVKQIKTDRCKYDLHTVDIEY